QRRQRRAEVAPKALVQGLQSAHLVFADALGALEIVGRHLVARAGDRRRGRRGGSRRRVGRLGVGVDRVEQALDFGLTKNISWHRRFLAMQLIAYSRVWPVP